MAGSRQCLLRICASLSSAAFLGNSPLAGFISSSLRPCDLASRGRVLHLNRQRISPPTCQDLLVPLNYASRVSAQAYTAEEARSTGKPRVSKDIQGASPDLPEDSHASPEASPDASPDASPGASPVSVSIAAFANVTGLSRL